MSTFEQRHLTLDEVKATMEVHREPPFDPGDSAMPLLDIAPVEVEGLLYCWLGEDGETAIALGHLTDDDLASFARALDIEAEPDAFEHGWIVALTHRPDCQDPDDYDVCEPCQSGRHNTCASEECDCALSNHEGLPCSCDVFLWWGENASVGTEGATAVTRWSY